MDTTEADSAAGVSCAAASGSPPVYRWDQCWQDNEGAWHWALCDTVTDQCIPKRVSCGYMVLHHTLPLGWDDRPIPEQSLPALIVRLLNDHYAKAANVKDQATRGA
jgi:hypothetical protein